MNNTSAGSLLLMIALSALCIRAGAENVYKCGSTYSQTPCPGAHTLRVEDPRSAESKRAHDALIQRDIELANELSATRQAQQHGASTGKAPARKNPKPGKQTEVAEATPPDSTRITPKRIKKPGHKRKDFTAIVPGSEASAGAAADKNRAAKAAD